MALGSLNLVKKGAVFKKVSNIKSQTNKKIASQDPKTLSEWKEGSGYNSGLSCPIAGVFFFSGYFGFFPQTTT